MQFGRRRLLQEPPTSLEKEKAPEIIESSLSSRQMEKEMK